MTLTASQGVPAPRELHLLTFAVRGVTIGVDAEQIAEMTDLDGAAARGLSLHHFPFGEIPAVYRAPKALLIKDRENPYFLVIDSPEDVSLVDTDSIQPLPALIAGRGSPRAFWGVIIRNDKVILLVDFYKLGVEQPDAIHEGR